MKTSTGTFIKRTALSVAVFCVVLATVLGSSAYVQGNRDQALLKEFTSQKLGLDAKEAEQFMAICSSQGTTDDIGKCSALRFVSSKAKCAQITSKLRRTSMNCAQTFVTFKGQVIRVSLTGYSEKAHLYMEVTLMQQHALLNII